MNLRTRRLPATASLWALALCLTNHAAAEERVDYLRSVKPILTARCYACHASLKQKSGLRVDTVELLKKGGEAGPAIIPGKSAASPLVQRITADTGRMPPGSEGEPLRGSEIALIRAWIDQGAAGPADEKPEADPREHWAFRAPVRPTLPQLRNPKPDIRNPIDAFLAVEWEKRGLTPQRPADRSLLLRRVYLDLIGLPPTRDEIQAFLADKSADAYEKVVDRLLGSKQYGERWGRHWMDVWRYSDWWGLGAEVRNSQKHIWHWRDWIIESLNADKGYDQMLREMLAADELYPADADKIRATGYLARSYFIFNRNTWLDEVVEHTSKAFLGLTLNCARCTTTSTTRWRSRTTTGCAPFSSRTRFALTWWPARPTSPGTACRASSTATSTRRPTCSCAATRRTRTRARRSRRVCRPSCRGASWRSGRCRCRRRPTRRGCGPS